MKKTLNFVLLALFALATPAVTNPIYNAHPPHIIIVMADDVGIDDVSFRGSKGFLTPNIDALGYHGMILDRLYAPWLCTPSRAALMTGKYPINTGMQHSVVLNNEPWGLPVNVPTIADIFRNSGYSTNLIGKWHLGSAKKEFTPNYRGFDYHYGYLGGFIDYYQRRSKMPSNITENLGYDFRRNLNLECGDRGTYVTDLLTSEAERVIMNHTGINPLFMIVSHLAGHTGNDDEPLQAPQEVVNKFKFIQDPDRRTYAAMISKLDESVGRIVGALDRKRFLSNSIVIFYSDNGAPSIGMYSNTGSNWPLRGQKYTPWEGGIRVAGAIWSPLLQKRSQVWRQNMYVGDWLPTLAAAAGIQLDPNLHLDGINLWNELSTGVSQNHFHRAIVHSLDDIDGVASYMRNNWKYINGTTLNGFASDVLTSRTDYEIDPSNKRYSTVVQDCQTSKCLRKFDKQPLSGKKINNLRAEAAIKCDSRTEQQRSCNPLTGECLFRIDVDPCERNNLASLPQYGEVLQKMRADVAWYRQRARPPGNKLVVPKSDPSWYHCAWAIFVDEAPTKEMAQCGYHGLPCSEFCS